MDKINRWWKWGGYVLAGLGLVVLIAGVSVDNAALNFALPLVFFMLAFVFLALGFNLSENWPWAVWLFVPGALLLSFGIIFLLNVLTGDWQAWAYAWLLLVAGLGAGLTLAARYGRLRQEFLMAGLGLVVVGMTFFAIFGVIAGGLAIKVAAPLMLIAGGAALSRLRPQAVLPERVLRRLYPEPPAAVLESADASAFPDEPRPPAEELVEPVSARELEVLRLIDGGLSNGQIAERLTLAPSTVKTHINNLYGKLGVQTRVQALNRARELGLLR